MVRDPASRGPGRLDCREPKRKNEKRDQAGMSGVGNSIGPEATRGDYRVVVYAPVDDRDAFTEILVQVGKIHFDDAVIAARWAPGILPARLSKDSAEAVAERIERQGIRAGAIAESEVPNLSDAETLHYLRCPSECLEVVGLHGETRRLIPWPDASLISLGALRKDRDPRLLPEPLVFDHEAAARREARSDFAPPGGMHLWLVCERPTSIYRLRHNQMNYAYLGQRMTTSATANFGQLVEDLAKYATTAYLTPATHAFLRNELARRFEFQSEDELRDYTAFHLLMSRQTARKPPAASGP
jgi:hypothetical protein